MDEFHDGILDSTSFGSEDRFKAELRKWRRENRVLRVKEISWWPEELPNDTEMQSGIRALEEVNYDVDYVISHCLPHDIVSVLSGCTFYPDRLTMYFNNLIHSGLGFDHWYCGHYHTDRTVTSKFHVLYKSLERLL